jgi:hypothetical protein
MCTRRGERAAARRRRRMMLSQVHDYVPRLFFSADFQTRCPFTEGGPGEFRRLTFLNANGRSPHETFDFISCPVVGLSLLSGLGAYPGAGSMQHAQQIASAARAALPSRPLHIAAKHTRIHTRVNHVATTPDKEARATSTHDPASMARRVRHRDMVGCHTSCADATAGISVRRRHEVASSRAHLTHMTAPRTAKKTPRPVSAQFAPFSAFPICAIQRPAEQTRT